MDTAGTGTAVDTVTGMLMAESPVTIRTVELTAAGMVAPTLMAEFPVTIQIVVAGMLAVGTLAVVVMVGTVISVDRWLAAFSFLYPSLI